VNIPSTIKIGGMDYTVEEKENEVRDKGRSGYSNANNQSIVVDKDMPQQLKETTFIHEVLHQIDYVYNIELSHKQVYMLEAGIYAFIKNNPSILSNEEGNSNDYIR